MNPAISEFTVLASNLGTSDGSTVWLQTARIENETQAKNIQMAPIQGIDDTFFARVRMSVRAARTCQVGATLSDDSMSPHCLLWRCNNPGADADHKHALFVHREELRIAEEMMSQSLKPHVIHRQMPNAVSFTSVCLSRGVQTVDCELLKTKTKGIKKSPHGQNATWIKQQIPVSGSQDVIIVTDADNDSWTVTKIHQTMKAPESPSQRQSLASDGMESKMPPQPLESAPAAASTTLGDSCVIPMPSFPEEAPKAPRAPGLGWLPTPRPEMLRGAISGIVSTGGYFWKQLTGTVSGKAAKRLAVEV
jgi:hypothetical protein